MGEIRVGKPDVDIEISAHTAGVTEGNSKGSYEKMAGHKPDGRSTAQRSTVVNPQFQEPIDPRMPNLSPP